MAKFEKFRKDKLLRMGKTSRHYRRSPLVQGGMEIPCLISIKMAATLKNTQLAEKYLELVNQKYAEPKEEEILGSFVIEIENEEEALLNAREKKKTPKRKRPASNQIDIRTMFGNKGRSNIKRPTKVTSCIEID